MSPAGRATGTGHGDGVPRLVATDLDGTLLRGDGTVSPRTHAALRAAQAAGVDVVFVTARPPRWVDLVADAVAGHGVVVCLNGAFVYDARARTVLEQDPLPDELVAVLVRDLRAALPGIAFAVERAAGIASEDDFDHHQHPAPQGSARARRIEDLLDGGTGKLLARCAGTADPDLVPRVAQTLGARAVVADSGARGLAEISGPGVTKAAALERWAAARGVAAAQVWAFGDMPNDLPMLTWAGRAVAVANAHPDVLACADEVCPANDDDGVATVLERVLAAAADRSGAARDGDVVGHR